MIAIRAQMENRGLPNDIFVGTLGKSVIDSDFLVGFVPIIIRKIEGIPSGKDVLWRLDIYSLNRCHKQNNAPILWGFAGSVISITNRFLDKHPKTLELPEGIINCYGNYYYDDKKWQTICEINFVAEKSIFEKLKEELS